MSSRKSTLEKIPLFPYTNFLRINGQYQHNSQCGGVASIVAILLVLAVLIMKLVEVFKMQTIISTSKTSINLQPPMTNVSTIQTSANDFPYMAAFGYYQDNKINSTASASAFYMTRVGSLSNSTPAFVQIKLEPCTTEHFSVIPNITSKSASWGLNNWQCLPLNKTWEIGGDYELSSVFKRIQFNFTCLSSSDSVNCGQYELYTLNSFINPTDPVNPSTYYISSDSFLLKFGSYYEYSSKLDNNNLITDTTVWPGEKLQTTTSLQSNQLVQQEVMDLSTIKATILKVEKSVRSTTYNRSYLKLVDALAFVGGIFGSILAIFFFMKLFGRYNFEMKFAEYYFNCKEARGVGFLPWLKQNIYNVLAPTPLKPDWEVMEKRIGLTKTVNKVLDIFYLHKRIAFLEQSLQLLLDPHQIKGMHLVHTQTKEEADENFRNHQLRERVVLYLKNYNDRLKMFGDIDDDVEVQPEQPKGGLTSAFVIHEELAEKKEGIVHEALFDQKKQAEELRAQRKEVDEVLNTEMMNIEMEEEEMDFDRLEAEFQTDLVRLFEEGERYDGDPRSIIICDKLEGWLKKGIQLSTKQNIITKSLISKKFSGLIK